MRHDASIGNLLNFSRRMLASGAIVLLALLLTTPAGSAHGRLLDSDPAASAALASMPGIVTLTFNEAIDVNLSEVDLFASDGTRIETGPLSHPGGDKTLLQLSIASPESVPPGVYTVVWRVLSEVDGHVTSGTVPFSSGTGEAPAIGATNTDAKRPPWWQVLARWLELSGWAGVTGIAIAAALQFPLTANTRAKNTVNDGWKSLWLIMFGVALAGMVLGIWAQTLLVSGKRSLALPDLQSMGDVLADTTYGLGWLARLALAAAALMLAGILPRFSRRWHWFSLATVAIAALFTISRTGHAAAEPRRNLAVAVDLAHLASGSTWVGGLLVLVVAIRTLHRSGTEELLGPAEDMTRRHSAISLMSVVVIITTGVLSASFHIGGFRSLRGEDYGVMALAKAALLVLVLVAAAINLLVLSPRLRILRRFGDLPGAWKQITSIRYVTFGELSGAILILLAAAVLTVVPPADAPLPVTVAAKTMTIDQRQTTGDVEVWLLAQLAGDPTDRYILTLTDVTGKPPANVQRVIVESSRNKSDDEEGIGDRFDAEQLEPDPLSYAFPASRLGLEGPWQLSVIVRRAGLEDVQTSFAFDTTGTSMPAPRLVEDTWRIPEMTPAAWGFVVLAGLMMIIGLAGLRFLTGLEPVASGVLLAMSVLIAAGFLVSAARQTVPVSASHDLQNPLPFDDSTVTAGEDRFLLTCVACHGVDGKGVNIEDSVHAHGEEVDLTDRLTSLQTDGDLYHWISQGVPSSDMAAYDQALSDEEIWQLVNYVRWLQGDRPKP